MEQNIEIIRTEAIKQCEIMGNYPDFVRTLNELEAPAEVVKLAERVGYLYATH